MEKENKGKSASYSIGGLVFVGCLLLGMGIGMILNERSIGMFIGMGVGFIAMAAIYYKMKK